MKIDCLNYKRRILLKFERKKKEEKSWLGIEIVKLKKNERIFFLGNPFSSFHTFTHYIKELNILLHTIKSSVLEFSLLKFFIQF
jgi:hypothetical protein